MIIVYDKKNHKFMGMATRVFDSGKWREPTLEELFPNKDRSNLGFVYVEDSLKYAVGGEKSFQFKLDDKGVPVGIQRKPSPPKILLTSDAPDTDGDGLAEVAADGKAVVTITAEIQEVGVEGKRVDRDVPLVFKTTGGTLSQRFVLAAKGLARVTLTASQETVTVTVTAQAEGLKEGSISFEFLPPVDAAKLQESSLKRTELEPRFGIRMAIPRAVVK
jgi:hypothetical protein